MKLDSKLKKTFELKSVWLFQSVRSLTAQFKFSVRCLPFEAFHSKLSIRKFSSCIGCFMKFCLQKRPHLSSGDLCEVSSRNRESSDWSGSLSESFSVKSFSLCSSQSSSRKVWSSLMWNSFASWRSYTWIYSIKNLLKICKSWWAFVQLKCRPF